MNQIVRSGVPNSALPNSVTIIDSSMHTAAEVEFGNFLTMMYFENTSATI